MVQELPSNGIEELAGESQVTPKVRGKAGAKSKANP